jgi:hypothetical protein
VEVADTMVEAAKFRVDFAEPWVILVFNLLGPVLQLRIKFGLPIFY